jgi:hypothetical protein
LFAIATDWSLNSWSAPSGSIGNRHQFNKWRHDQSTYSSWLPTISFAIAV